MTHQPIVNVNAMEDQDRWVTKPEAAEELEISLSTLDRRIKKGEIEVFREGRRVWVLMHGPEYLSDNELLLRAAVREEELKRKVKKLKGTVSEFELRAAELERERDEAIDTASTARRPYLELEEKYRKEKAEHNYAKEGIIMLRVMVIVLLLLLVGGVLLWWFVLR